MSRLAAVPVMVLLLVLAPPSGPASSDNPVTSTVTVNPALAPETAAGGLLHLRVKHKPVEEAGSVQVTVRNVKVQKSDAKQGPGWITVIKGDKTFELVSSESGEDILGARNLAEGSYSRVQLDIVSVKVTRKGEQKSAKVTISRLREVRPFDIDMARVCILTLDFDVARSLTVTGNGEILFKPVVRFVLKRGAPG